MCRFPLLNDLHSFSSRRATEGCEHWVPVVINDPHYISLLPGADPLSQLFHIQTCSEAEQIVHLVKYIFSETQLKEHLLPWPSCYPCYSFSCVWGEVSKWNSYMRAYDKLTMSVCFFFCCCLSQVINFTHRTLRVRLRQIRAQTLRRSITSILDCTACRSKIRTV